MDRLAPLLLQLAIPFPLLLIWTVDLVLAALRFGEPRFRLAVVALVLVLLGISAPAVNLVVPITLERRGDRAATRGRARRGGPLFGPSPRVSPGDCWWRCFGDSCRVERAPSLNPRPGAEPASQPLQCSEPAYRRPADHFECQQGGSFHLCVTGPAVEGLAKRIAETDGKMRSSLV